MAKASEITPQAAVGLRVRAIRRAAGLTLEQLAERADLHGNYVGQVERGTTNPSLDVLSRLAVALNVDVVALIDSHESATTTELRRLVRERIATFDATMLRRVLRVLDALR